MRYSTVDRVPAHTNPDINARIARKTEMRIYYYAAHRDEIDARLAELDREWDIDRTLEAQSGATALLSLVLALTTGSRKWLAVTAATAGFLLNHAVKGWCPPLALHRRLGVRTQNEIAAERYALKALRGDFDKVDDHAGQEKDAGPIIDATLLN